MSEQPLRPEFEHPKFEPEFEKSRLDTSNPVRVYHTKRNWTIAIIVIVALVVGIVFAWRGAVMQSSQTANGCVPATGSQSDPVKIGVIGATDKQWVLFSQEAQEQGIYVKLIDFQDYTSENPAVATCQLDMNEFQHLLYLVDYNIANNEDLQPIGGTAIYPLGLYSAHVKKVSDIQFGQTVAVPNDETNQARALGVLQAAGLIAFKDGNKWTPFVTPADIDTAASKVKVTALAAQQVANSLSDPTIAAGIINNDYVADAGLKATDAIYQDSAESASAQPYINIFAARKADLNNPTYLTLIKIWQGSSSVWAALQEQADGSAVKASQFTIPQLQKILATTTQEAQKQEK
jgi:D-methionine transport system substrate-binding protein